MGRTKVTLEELLNMITQHMRSMNMTYTITCSHDIDQDYLDRTVEVGHGNQYSQVLELFAAQHGLAMLEIGNTLFLSRKSVDTPHSAYDRAMSVVGRK
jgi:hypothetical protein